jgi:hypothetical protein
MAHLTINELIDIVFEARHIYQVQFANRRIPNIRAIVSSVEDQLGTRRFAGQHNILHSSVFAAWRFTIYRQEFCEWFLGQDKLESNFFK